MDFHYSDLADTDVPAAYERLLLDVIKGDTTLYARGDSVEEAWRFVAPILDAWKEDAIPVIGYPIGSWGPTLANDLAENTWKNACPELSYECEDFK